MRAAISLLAAWTLMTASVRADPPRGDALSAPRPGETSAPHPAHPNAPRSDPSSADELDAPREGSTRETAETERDEGFAGPRVELGFAHYVIPDGRGGGDVNAGSFAGYLPTGRLRLGAEVELGLRDYQLADGTDVIFRAHALVGYQHLPGVGPLVPYVAIVGTAGVLLGKRFSTPVSYVLLGGGIEVGVDLVMVRTLFLGISLAYLRMDVEGDGLGTGYVRVRLGL